MDESRLIDLLNSLIQVDLDASRAYGQALENTSNADVYAALSGFRRDHERHIDDLIALVRSRSVAGVPGRPIERVADLKGFLLEGFTAIRSATGTVGALRAMRLNELLTNKRYTDALAADLPPEVREVIARNQADERRHFDFIEQAIVRPVMV